MGRNFFYSIFELTGLLGGGGGGGGFGGFSIFLNFLCGCFGKNFGKI